MLDFPRWKIWLIVSSLLVGVLLSVPTFFPERLYNRLPSFMQAKVNLGLDLSGGSHILLEANPAEVAKQRLENMEEQVRTELRRGDPKIAIGDISRRDGKLAFMVRDPSQVDAAVERIRPLTQGAGLTGGRATEADEALRARLLARIREPPRGGAASDYDFWARQVAGIGYVSVEPNGMGLGTVRVVVALESHGSSSLLSLGEPLRHLDVPLAVLVPTTFDTTRLPGDYAPLWVDVRERTCQGQHLRGLLTTDVVGVSEVPVVAWTGVFHIGPATGAVADT